MARTIDDIIKQFKQDGLSITRKPQSYKFWDFDNNKKALITAFKKIDGSVTDMKWLPQYDEVVKWMVDTEGKGLLLRGSCGVGKTSLLNALVALFAYRGILIKPMTAYDLTTKENIVKQSSFCIDDFGVEPVKNNYGEKVEMFSVVVNNAETYMKLMLLSTNLTSEDIMKRYGQRTLDRLVRLCKVVNFMEQKPIYWVDSLHTRWTCQPTIYPVFDAQGKQVCRSFNLPSMRR